MQDLVAKLQLQLQNPLAVPILGSLAALLFSIVALYSCAVAGQKKKKPAGGTIITEQGLRRSTRWELLLAGHGTRPASLLSGAPLPLQGS